MITKDDNYNGPLEQEDVEQIYRDAIALVFMEGKIVHPPDLLVCRGFVGPTVEYDTFHRVLQVNKQNPNWWPISRYRELMVLALENLIRVDMP